MYLPEKQFTQNLTRISLQALLMLNLLIINDWELDVRQDFSKSFEIIISHSQSCYVCFTWRALE